MTAPRNIACGLAASFLLASAVPAVAAPVSNPVDLRPQAAAVAADMDFDTSPAPPPPVALPRKSASHWKPRKQIAVVPLPRPNPRRAIVQMPDPLPVAPAEIAALAGPGAVFAPPDLAPDTSLTTGSTAPTPAVSPLSAPAAAPSEAVPPPSAVAPVLPIAIPADAAPYALVRILQLTQDRIAGGSSDALAAQRDLFARIDRDFAAADPAVWLDPRNAAAAVTYVLSGGPPTVLKQMLLLKAPAAIDDKLVRGALAYVEGREAEALTYLGEIDATTLPVSMAGQMALAQAALAVRADPARAMALLDTARLIAPGTLVEEAALRREIFLADQTGDEERFEQLTRSYLERFRHSAYAGNFRNRFEAALSHTKLLDAPDQFPRIQSMLEQVEPAGRTELYLTVSRAAALQMKLPVGVMAAEAAAGLASAGSVEEARALLYGAAALAVTKGSLDKALADLKSIDRAKLSLSDQMLFDSVSRVAASIRDADAHPGGTPLSDGALAAAFEQVPAVATKAMEALRATEASVAKEES